MYRFRFHGRGGQGVKTASRIFGSAAFLEGYYAQDFPMYGPERRGAPVTAYVRVSNDNIVERGFIDSPNVVIVADESLLNDPIADPLRGFKNGILFINTPHKPVFDSNFKVELLDVTGLALEHIGRTSAISAGIGAVASKLAGFSKENVLEAVEHELRDIGIDGELLDKNIRLAEVCYDRVNTYDLDSILDASLEYEYPETEIVDVKLDDVYYGVATIVNIGNTASRRTGGWRIMKPIIDYGKCRKCRICYVYCPDVSILLDEDDTPRIDYEHCKGCLICSSVCPFKAITIVREVETL